MRIYLLLDMTWYRGHCCSCVLEQERGDGILYRRGEAAIDRQGIGITELIRYLGTDTSLQIIEVVVGQ